MKLEKIKLAGFKSFVDPTTVHLPSNLVGVVGPNGCGKSNVIDAVRWVMGESSAKMLRGESMSDVIFNGSSSRKPVGTASIELLFDNSDGSAGGQYAQYGQISVKRQVFRDGQSSYFLNSVRCRRRDITDLFLGTGLGPRSYSIIEQGMISRLIEARPEDLRAFLEEAAGISKYKERRRETENRIKHTRENLSRLNDLIDEVQKQLHHLDRQAATAEKYKKLKEQERRQKAELLALRWRTLDAQLQQQERLLAEQETALEAAVAEQRRLEAAIEHERENHSGANDEFNRVQGRYYAVGSEIAKLEQAIKYTQDTQEKQRSDLTQTEQAWQEAKGHQQQDHEKLQGLISELSEEEPEYQQARQREEAVNQRLAEEEQAMQAWQAEWDEFNRQAAQPAESAQVERTRINHLEQQEQGRNSRLGRFDEELQRLLEPGLQQEIDDLQGREQGKEQEGETLKQRLSNVQNDIREIRESNAQSHSQQDEIRAELQTVMGRLASLEALQEAALGKDQGETTEWLEQWGLSEATRLAERIEVESGWQHAVEAVLGFHLQSVCSSQGLDQLASGITELQQGALSILDTAESATRATPGADALSAKVKSSWPVDSLLAGIRVADGVEQALAMRSGLQLHESVITPEGVWIGPNWLRFSRATEQSSGVLAREEEIRALSENATQLEARAETLAQTLQQGKEKLHEAEQAREQLQKELDALNRELSEIRSGLSGKRARAEHLKNRRESVRAEMEELRQQMNKDQDELEQSRTRLHQALEEMETLGAKREALVKKRDALRARLTAAGEEARRERGKVHEIALKLESKRSVRESLDLNLKRVESQLQMLSQRREELRSSLESAEQPLREQNEELEQQLKLRVQVEEEMKQARRTLDEIDAKLRGLEQERNGAEEKVNQKRSVLDQSRMRRQEVMVRHQTVADQVSESGFNRDELLAELPQDANSELWEEELARLDARIRRLGPINLAAIDEFKEQSERKQYLDSQHADVNESLNTLENAIRKIDRETRTRFKETFDKVNAGLQEKFPRLFGGGHAYLQLTGEDLLDTGVTVMARPPGKRNTSIHLLSGGEKALTAVALVFAIFELNPAPFCMLDEVDAPLDDANVGRFCELVKSMSDRVQFIVITHNKITMEIAEQLTGVTMHEAGVSRLVSVDVEQAAQMAAS